MGAPGVVEIRFHTAAEHDERYPGIMGRLHPVGTVPDVWPANDTGCARRAVTRFLTPD